MSAGHHHPASMPSAKRRLGGRLRVLIVDDSALMRRILTEIVNATPDLEAVGAARDPLAAEELIRTLNPDVITLDVEMPRMDGLTFLARLMRLRPTPVVMVSSLTEYGSETTLKALELGAVDFIAKPKKDPLGAMGAYAEELAEKIRTAAIAHLRPPPNPYPQPAAVPSRFCASDKLVLVGASTGGTEAIKEFLINFPPQAPAVLVTQHMPEGFTRSFARRLDGLCRIAVKEAEHGERVLPGHAYIAPGHSHLKVRRSGAHYTVELSQEPPVNRHRPSVEVLFRSAAQWVGGNAVGVILTGMGKDGAVGMLEMKRAGAYNFAQDEATCVVFGMPREAIALGAVDEVLPIQRLAAQVLAHLARA